MEDFKRSIRKHYQIQHFTQLLIFSNLGCVYWHWEWCYMYRIDQNWAACEMSPHWQLWITRLDLGIIPCMGLAATSWKPSNSSPYISMFLPLLITIAWMYNPKLIVTLYAWLPYCCFQHSKQECLNVDCVVKELNQSESKENWCLSLLCSSGSSIPYCQPTLQDCAYWMTTSRKSIGKLIILTLYSEVNLCQLGLVDVCCIEGVNQI